MEIQMTIKGLMIDPITNMPIIVLRDDDGQRVLPIWVGIFEANAIAMQLEEIVSPRPMTHDLLKNVIESLHAQVKRVVITDLKDNTFFAIIHLDRNGRSADNDQLMEILMEVKAKSLEKKGLLDNDEFMAIANSILD